MSGAERYFSPQWAECDMLCIVGPTASGKTRFAVECAERIKALSDQNGKPKFTGAEIISADSRQVYRGMDLGTGKDLNEYGAIPYHLINIADAGEKYNLFRYKQDFENAYNEIARRGAFPILCGGSGLYVEAVCRGYALKEVAPNHRLRAELEGKKMEELSEMLTELKKKNGSLPHNVTDFDTKKRVIRAIEIELGSSIPSKGENCSTTASGKKGLKVHIVGLRPSRRLRNERIDVRLKERLASGMIEEVRALLNSGIKEEDLIYYGLEYKFITQYLRGDFSYDYMQEHLAIAIHQFAKRQMTYLRGMERRGLPIEWVDIE